MAKLTKMELAAKINDANGNNDLTSAKVKKLSHAKLVEMYDALCQAPEFDEDDTLADASNEITIPAEVAPSSLLDIISASVTKATETKPAKVISRKSTVEGPCRIVWDLCDSMNYTKEGGARRKDVLKAAEEAGVAHYTARTQIQLWRKATLNPDG